MKQKKRMKEGLIPPDPTLTGGGGPPDHHNTSPLSQNHNTDSNSSSGGPLKSESPIGNSVHDNVQRNLPRGCREFIQQLLIFIMMICKTLYFICSCFKSVCAFDQDPPGKTPLSSSASIPLLFTGSGVGLLKHKQQNFFLRPHRRLFSCESRQLYYKLENTTVKSTDVSNLLSSLSVLS